MQLREEGWASYSCTVEPHINGDIQAVYSQISLVLVEEETAGVFGVTLTINHGWPFDLPIGRLRLPALFRHGSARDFRTLRHLLPMRAYWAVLLSCIADAAAFCRRSTLLIQLGARTTLLMVSSVNFRWKSFGWAARVCVNPPLVTLLFIFTMCCSICCSGWHWTSFRVGY